MTLESLETGSEPPDSGNAAPDDTDAVAADWDGDELELAYRKALEAVEAVEQEVERQVDTAGPLAEANTPTVSLAEARSHSDPATAELDAPQPHDVTPRQIIEAALFVGGTPLTMKRLGSILRSEFDHDFIDETIRSLNSQYAAERRPYEIAFGEGGYRLVLHADFERLRDRAYGFGPKEVKLSQDALEVLALVAYRPPISKEQVEQAGKKNPGAILRQLVRRQLIAIERVEKGSGDVNYRTTPRFLELFGLKDLDELPQSDDDLNFR